jgi:hypothetical protein
MFPKAKSRKNHARTISLARSKNRLLTTDEIIHFLSLSLCGYAGRFSALIASRWQGNTSAPHAVLKRMIAEDMAEIRITLEDLAEEMGIDLDAVCGEVVDRRAEMLDMDERHQRSLEEEG